MHPLQFLNFAWAMILGLSIFSGPQPGEDVTTMSPVELAQSADAVTVACDCEIHQGSNTYPISALLGNETDVQFYSYGNPDGASANTGLELENTLVLFFYQDTTTGIVSLFMIADIANSGTGGTMEAEINCLPDEAVLSVGDEPGEFFGAPPLMTGDWAWTGCCTDGGAIGNIGCGNSFNLDLLASSGIDSIVWLTGDINNPEHIVLSMSGESLWIDCGGGVCCPVGFDTQVTLEDASCPDTPDGSISLEPQDGTPNYTFSWSTGATTQSINGLLPGTYLVTITDSQVCTDELEVELGVSPGIPPANPAAIEICSAEAEDYFDLTSV